MKENWKDIPNYIGIYQVSDLGNVKSLGRIKYCGKNTIKGTYYKEKLLTKNTDNFGYSRVNLWKNSSCKMIKVHKLVADAFIAVSEKLTDINHVNGIKTDNRLINLERCTRSENIQHAYATGLRTIVKIRQMDLEGNEIKIFPGGQIEAEKHTGINCACISNAINGKSKTAGGFKWEITI